jgi:hypothetical protein
MRAPWLTRAAAAAVALTLVPFVLLAELDLGQRRLAGASERGERYYVPPPPLLRAMTFGYNELAADLLWIRTVAYYVQQLLGDRDFRNLQRFVTTILVLDERFKEVYRFAAPMFLLQSGPDNEHVLAGIELLERGHRHFPEEYGFAFSIGAAYMSDLRTQNPAQRARWRRQAADWLHRAALLGDDVPWLPSLVARLHTEQGERGLAIRHLQELYLTTQDEAMKTQIAAKLRSLEAAHLADELREQAQRFAREQRESELSFVAPDLYALIGLPPLPRFRLQRELPQEQLRAAAAR